MINAELQITIKHTREELVREMQSMVNGLTASIRRIQAGHAPNACGELASRINRIDARSGALAALMDLEDRA